MIRTSAGRYAASVAAGESSLPAPAASITAVTTASTIAPPTWNEVWNKLAARPCSASGTPGRGRHGERGEPEAEGQADQQRGGQHHRRVVRPDAGPQEYRRRR